MFVGLPYEFSPLEGELNYKLRVMYNNNTLVPRNVLVKVTSIADEYVYRTVRFIQMNQEVSSIALWNPVASIIFASFLLPIQSTQTSLPKGVGNSNNNFEVSGEIPTYCL